LLPHGEPLGLDRLLPPLMPTPDHGLVTVPTPAEPPLHTPIGTTEPHKVCWADLSSHTLVLGSTPEARTNTLGTLIAGLALIHPPSAVQFFCVSAGPGVTDLAELPHIGAIIPPDDRAAMIGLLQHVASQWDRNAALYLVIDSPSQLSRLAPELIATADAAPGREVHLLVSADAWEQVPDGLRDWFGTRIDLETPATGRISGRRSPSRSFLSAAARIGIPLIGDAGHDERRRLAAEVAEHWAPRRGAPAFHPPLPTVTPAAPATPGFAVRLGTDEREQPVNHDFAHQRSLVLRGPAGSGKTTLLRAIAAELVRGRTPAEVRILLVDYPAGLIDAVPEDFLLGHAFHANALRDLIDGTLWALAGRRSASEDAPWRGPRLFVLVDDHVHKPDDEDIWAPVLDHLASAGDAGVHLVVAEAAEQSGAPATDDISTISLTQAMLDIGAADVVLAAAETTSDQSDLSDLSDLATLQLPGPGRQRPIRFHPRSPTTDH
jgi:S-DNA-T family DNA segregation ATPase FtsK/SpoIIIE